MSETEWLKHDDVRFMLEFCDAARILDTRQRRLFVSAALRYLLVYRPALATAGHLAAIEALEHFADDNDETVLERFWRKTDLPRPGIALGTCAAARLHARQMANFPELRLDVCFLLRDIVGNPHAHIGIEVPGPVRPLVLWRVTTLYDGEAVDALDNAERIWPEALIIKLAWKTPLVLSLAEAAYNDRGPCKPQPPLREPTSQTYYQGRVLQPDRLLILADALEDEGCAQPVLDELRRPAPHVRGYWLLDLLLQKE